MNRKYHTLILTNGDKYHLRQGFTEKRGAGSKEGMYHVVEGMSIGDVWITIRYQEDSTLRIPLHQVASIQTNVLEADLS